MPPDSPSVVLGFDAVTKVFPPGVVALDGVSVDVLAGEIHAFVGENGAGKSTLMRIANGEVGPDAGSVRVKGRVVRYRSAGDAMRDGVGMVHQEILLVAELTVWENVVLGQEPVGRFGRVDVRSARAAVLRSIEAYGLDLDPDALVGELSIAARQKVEICKLLHRDVDVLILDEPTAVLTPQEIPQLFAELRRLRDAGRTICFVSHRLDEVLELSDRVTVLRDGAHVATIPASGATIAGLARLMVERDVVLTSQRTEREAGDVVLAVEGLRWRVDETTTVFGPIDLVVRAGEIVGVAGVEGNGQTGLVGGVVGNEPILSGTVRIDGADCTRASVLDHRRHLSYVAQDRRTMGGAVTAPIVDNTAMTHHRLTPGFSAARGWWQRRARARAFADEVHARFDVAMRSIDEPLGSLSGGNQQKVILGRELLLDRPLVVLDQPTRGLDVGSIEYVHGRILELRANGRAVLLVSADLDELFRLSDRIVVLHRGRVALDVGIADATPEVVGRAMLEGPAAGSSP